MSYHWSCYSLEICCQSNSYHTCCAIHIANLSLITEVVIPLRLVAVNQILIVCVAQYVWRAHPYHLCVHHFTSCWCHSNSYHMCCAIRIASLSLITEVFIQSRLVAVNQTLIVCVAQYVWRAHAYHLCVYTFYILLLSIKPLSYQLRIMIRIINV